VVVDGTHASTGDETTPVPVRLTELDEPAALEATETLPEAAPVLDGVNVTDNVQLAAAARLVPQLFVTPNPLVAAMEVMDNAAEPLFVRVTGRAVEATPTV
jgi:hypothetical protein